MGNQQPAETTHHRPATFPVPAEPVSGEHPMLTFTRDIARRIRATVGAAAIDYMSYQQFPPSAPAELHGWKRHQIGIAGHTVVILGVPDAYLQGVTDYTVEVSGEPAPYRFLFSRPLAELLADAASAVITARRTA
ncbi:hypothetical protein [Micromonospora sp. CPCC 206061]|uniref:hypothetical protein n=1 Tax=Micromonospora sp. CPCC 206061 TaxID=3122410 RepID=UPI002FF3E976